MNRIQAEDILVRVSLDSRLQEGYQGVRLIMREILRGKNVPLHDISRATGIPVPAVSAARRELEKRGLLSRRSGAILTEYGVKILTTLGVLDTLHPASSYRYVIPDSVKELILEFEKLVAERPSPDYSLDQSHVLSDTCFKRVMYFHENDGLEGRDIAILGDDDLTSLAVAMFSNRFQLEINSLTVFDIDQRVLDFIDSKCKQFGLNINLNEINLIEEIPKQHKNMHDIFITDPPYTVQGLTRFVNVGGEMIRENTGGIGFVSYPNLRPTDNSVFFENISSMGLSPQELIPGFNEYVGSQIHAGRSNMGRFFVPGGIKDFGKIFSDRIYTKSRNT